MYFEDQKNQTEQSFASDPHTNENVSEVEKKELIACQQEMAVWKERYMRMSADLENMRRRMAKDHEVSLIAAQSDIFSDLLAVVDNFDRALADQKIITDETCKNWVEGVALIRKELASILASYGVEEITEVYTFDPEIHEALAHVESEDHESGDIVEVLQKGYRFKGRVLRHAKVTVAR